MRPLRRTPESTPNARARSVAAAFILLAACALPGCTNGPDVDYTVPADGQTGVSPATEIVVAFTSELDPETAIDVNFVVFGSTSGMMTTTSSLDETGRILTIDTGETSFANGERVTVSLTSAVTTTIGIAIDDYSFSFRILGTSAAPEDFDPAENQFVVTDLEPENGTTGLAQRPLVRADFDRNVLASSIDGGAILRGSVTGTRSAIATGTALQGQGEGQTAGQVLVQLAPSAEPFEPGERVTVTLLDSLTSPASGPAQAATLRPFVASYEARGGHVGSFSEALPLPLATGTQLPAAVSAAFGELVQFEGPELALLGADGKVYVLRSTGGTGPSTILSSFATDLPAAMRCADVDDDGLLEIVVATRTGLLEVLQLVGGSLERAREAVEIPGGEPYDLEIADLDGDGYLDVVVGVAEGLQFFQQIPSSGLPPLPGVPVLEGFVPVTGDPLVAPVTEVEVGDLDGDGRLDIVARAASGTVVLRNAGGFLFAEVSVLTSQSLPGTIRIADFEGDTRADIVAGAPNGVLVHANPGTGIPAPTWTYSSLALGVAPEGLEVGNIDGDADRRPDLLVAAPAAPAGQRLVLHRRTGPGYFQFAPQPIAVSDPAPSGGGIALGDANRDGARDILLLGAAAGGGRLLLARSQDVTDAGDPVFAFALDGPSSVDLGSDVVLTLVADLEEDISQFTVALEWDPAFDLVSATPDPITFPGTAPTPVIEAGDGVGYVTVDIGSGVVAKGDTVPLLSFLFRQTTAQPGLFPFELAAEVSVSETLVGASQVVLESEGIAFPDISEGTVEVTMSSSVPAPTGLACASVGGGVQLSWSNPTNYQLVRIRRNGVFLSSLGGGATSFLDESTLPAGNVTYQVIGVQDGIDSLPATCSVSLFGTLTCTRLENSPTRIRLTWTTSGAYQTITILRDGNLVGTVSGTQSAFTDDTGDLNGHSYQVYGTANGVDSSPATCPQGEVPDAPGGAGIVDPVTQVTLSVEQGTATVTWQNGEAYDQILVRRNGTDIATLDGGVAEFVDPDLLPSTYQYSVRGDADGVAGIYVASNTVDSDLPIPTGLACTLAGGNQIQLAWTNGPQSYSYDSILVERTLTGQSPVIVATLSGAATGYLDTGLADGEYVYRVVGVYAGLQAASSFCDASLQNLFRVSDLATTPGRSATIEIDGQLLAAATGFAITLRYDGDRAIFSGLRVLGNPVSGAAPSAPDADGLRTLEITASGVDLQPGFGIPLARIDVLTAESFAAVGESPLEIVSAEVTPVGGSPFAPATANGVLDVEPFGIFFEPQTVLPGGLVEGWVLGTFANPIYGYELTMQFDPDVLTAIEISELGTIGESVNPIVFTNYDNSAGFVSLAMIVLPGPSGFIPIPPQVAEPLAYVRFLVDPGAGPGVTTLEFADWITPGEETSDFGNAFFDEDAMTIEPTVFPGFVTVVEPEVPPVVLEVDPASGPAEGGAQVLVLGSGFFGDPEVRFGGVPATVDQVLSAEEILVTTPPGTGTVAVTVETPVGSSTLPGAYTYIPLALESVSPPLLNTCSTVEVTLLIEGTGFVPGLEVQVGAATAVVLQVDPAGTSAEVLAPAFALAAPGGVTPVDVTVTNPSGSTTTLPGALDYTADFIRGDVNFDGVVNAADLSYLGAAIAGTGPMPQNADAADVDDNGIVHIGDLVRLGDWLFQAGTPPPPAPFPELGPDPTEDGIVCE